MNRIVLTLLALALATTVTAQLYKWVDKDGKTYYSDTPPSNVDSKQLNVQSGAPSAAAVPAGPKTAVDRDKDAEKSRQAGREAGKKSDDDAKMAAAKAENCARAREAVQTYSDGGRITKYNDKGERVFLSDEDIAANLQKARREADEACKPS